MKGEVYSQSVCLLNTVAEAYYIQRKTQTEISKELGISIPTVSRLARKAVDDRVIRFQMDTLSLKCLEMERTMEEKYGIRNVMVVPVRHEDELECKRTVALECSRYLQRKLDDNGVLGLNWGGTMYHMIELLNPCLKKNVKIVTMHGSLKECGSEYDVGYLVKRAAMSFGGQKIILGIQGYVKDEKMLQKIMQEQRFQKVEKIFQEITVSVAGIGVFYPKLCSPLRCYMKEEEWEELQNRGVCCDFMLHFIDRAGKECKSQIKNRTLAIDLDHYRKIPCKVVAASGRHKASGVLSILKGKLADVLIIDVFLAESVIGM